MRSQVSSDSKNCPYQKATYHDKAQARIQDLDQEEQTRKLQLWPWWVTLHFLPNINPVQKILFPVYIFEETCTVKKTIGPRVYLCPELAYWTFNSKLFFFRMKNLSESVEKQHELLKLIIQKMEIHSEADDRDVGGASVLPHVTPTSARACAQNLPPIVRQNILRQATIVQKWSKFKKK